MEQLWLYCNATTLSKHVKETIKLQDSERLKSLHSMDANRAG